MAKKRKQDKQKSREDAATALLLPAVSMAAAIGDLYGQLEVDGDGTTGLDEFTIAVQLTAQNEALQSGDMARIESILLDQAHTLQAIFSVYTSKAARAEYLAQMEGLARVALKAQNQCRQTLATLGELKNPRRVNFIKQQNNAANQQINNGASPSASAENPKNSDERENRQLEVLPNERLDLGTTPATSRANQALETVGEVHGAKDA